MRRLREVNLQNNLIERIPETIFNITVDLTKVDLSSNQILALPEKLLSPLLNLQMFSASRNLIEVLPANLFSGNPKLAYVNLNNNRIKSITINFVTLRSIKRILGFQNTCADFYLNDEMTAEKLNALVREKCAPVKKKDED